MPVLCGIFDRTTLWGRVGVMLLLQFLDLGSARAILPARHCNQRLMELGRGATIDVLLSDISKDYNRARSVFIDHGAASCIQISDVDGIAALDGLVSIQPDILPPIETNAQVKRGHVYIYCECARLCRMARDTWKNVVTHGKLTRQQLDLEHRRRELEPKLAAMEERERHLQSEIEILDGNLVSIEQRQKQLETRERELQVEKELTVKAFRSAEKEKRQRTTELDQIRFQLVTLRTRGSAIAKQIDQLADSIADAGRAMLTSIRDLTNVCARTLQFFRPAELGTGPATVTSRDLLRELGRLPRCAQKNTIIFFTASWCPPCQVVKQYIREIRTLFAWSGSVVFLVPDEVSRLDAAKEASINDLVLLSNSRSPEGLGETSPPRIVYCHKSRITMLTEAPPTLLAFVEQLGIDICGSGTSRRTHQPKAK